MLSYIVRRLVLLPTVYIGVTLFIFGMLQFLSPYERVFCYISSPTKVTKGALEQLIEKYGFDDPIPVQYFRWLSNVIHGNLGWSQTAGMSVSDAILHFFPATLELGLYAILLVLFLGIPLGELSAVQHNKLMDHIIRVIAITGWSFPTFVFAILVLMIFYGGLNWFPPGRLSDAAAAIVHSAKFTRYTGMYTIDALLNGNMYILGDALRHLILPVVSLAYVSWALVLRTTRSSMLETLRQNYVTTARAKGLKESIVIKKHARKNALIPVVTIGGLMVIWLLGGDVVVEVIFNYRGLGWWAANAALQLDIPSVLGFALFSALLVVVVNLVVDIAYALIDPRVKLQ